MSQASSGEYLKNVGLNSREVKNKILKYLYTSQINLNQKYESILNLKDLDNVRDGDYLICPRFSGTRSWIIFFHVNNNYYAVNFPKHSQRKKEDLYMHPIEMSVDKKFYRGTIMEGIFFRMDNRCFLVVDEVYSLFGEDQLLKSKEDRLNYLSECIKIDTNINPDYHMYVSQFFNTNKKSLKELYEKIKADSKIQEIIFYPRQHGKKIYKYTIIDTDLIDNVVKLSQFRLQKTASPDVYNLLTKLSGKKMGIACIPDIETSKKCKQWFKDNKAKELLVKCQMDPDRKGWIPLEIVEDDVRNPDNGHNVVEV